MKDQAHGGVKSLTTSDPSRQAGLTGWVIEVNDRGGVQGGLPDATLQLVNGPTTITATTDQLGEFRFGGLNPGTYSLTASKVGYYSGSPRTISLGAGETRSETLQLAMQSGAGSPSVFDFLSPNGKHFIEGMPGDLSFEVTVAWNGSPGSVDFTIAGTRYPGATLTDLGGGLARARLTIAAPSTISNCGELTVKVVNGVGKKTYANTGVHFYPLPGSIILWYGDNIPWVPSGAAISYMVENSGYVGVLAEYLVFQYEKQLGVEFSFEEEETEPAGLTDEYRKASTFQPVSRNEQLGSVRLIEVTDLPSSPAWKPIGDALLKWGAANRLLDTQPTQGLRRSSVEESRDSAAGMLAVHPTQLASLPDEETVVENVTSLASPGCLS